MTPKRKKAPSFEEGMDRLEELVDKLSSGELSLEESIALYEQGTTLCTQLKAMLDEQKKRLEMIDPDTAEMEPLKENEHEV